MPESRSGGARASSSSTRWSSAASATGGWADGGVRRRWGKSLIFFHTLEQGRQCHRRLAELGFAAEVVTAQPNRERQLADFAAGRVDVMINMLLLSEGFDCPSLRTVFCRPSGKLCTIQ